MADKWPLANGNWSNAANWNGGTLPAIGDDVYADGRTITLDVSIDIGTGTLRTSQRSGGTAGGSFITTPGITITANVAAGTAAGISHSSGFVTVNGNIGRGTNGNAHGIYSNSSGGMQINGNTNGNQAANGADIYCANGTTTITGNIVSNGSGGGAALWIQGGDAVVNGNITSNGVNAVWMIAGGLTVNGIVTGNTGAGAITNYSSANPITINGNLTGQVAYAAGSFASSPVIINGNITSTGSGNCVQIFTASTPSLVVTGNVSGGSLTNAIGINVNVSTPNITINGNVTGGSGTTAYGLAMTGGMATVTINGGVTGGTGSGAFGLYNNTLGTARVLGTAIGNNHGLGGSGNSTPAVFGYGVSSGTAQATTSVRRLQYGPKGQSPTAGLVQLDVTDLSLCSVKMRGIPPTFTEYTLATAENLGSLPSESDVRLGTVFNFGTRTGTCAVPPAASVAIGVPVDNTVGTAAITAASISSALADEFASVLSAIGNIEVDNVAIAQAVETQLAGDFNTVNTNLAAVGLAVVDRPTLTQIEGSTVLAKESNATNNKTQILDAVGNIEVDNVAIAQAVETQLADDFQDLADAIEGVELDESAIATSVFQLLVGSGVARYALPTDDGTVEAIRYVDFDLDITTVATAADSKFVLTIGCEGVLTPYLVADSETGLVSLQRTTEITTAWASVERISSTLVRVYISANAMKNVPSAEFLIELRELTTDGKVKLRYERPFVVRSGAGRTIE